MRALSSVLLLAALASALPSLPSASSDLVARQQPPYDLRLPLERRHGDDEDEEEETEPMDHHHEMEGVSETASAALPVHSAAHSHGGDEHDHHHSHAAPLLVINETQILLTHSPSPPSYFDFDLTDDGKPTVLYIHIALMCIAFFGLLPLALFLKAGGSSISIIPQTAFLATSILGLFFGQVYNGLTPNMYEKSSHTSWGWGTMALAFGLNVVDVARFVLRFTRWGNVLEAKIAELTASKSEEKVEASAFQLGEDEEDEHERLVHSPVEMEHDHAQGWSSPSSSTGPVRQSSTFSDEDTVFDSAGPDSHHADQPRSTRSRLRRVACGLLTFAERFLIILAWIEVCTGVAVWTGTCRERYINGCLAHIIKGSIFFWYGLLTFARYCGAFSSLGWAWNRHPSKNDSIWTAEFVESLVIFTYGSTNTWMERFGKTGAWSVKDVQHTAIAVMFWAAGALGMALESRTVRSWLAASAAQASGRNPDSITPPASASFPMNPFPALVIGFTGISMAAHHQMYLFQVEIHALWGNLLAGFALFRFLTYFFLYLRPPASILPSRPPTEALASFCLAAGGIMFILSTEEVTFAAMRHGWDDQMAFAAADFSYIATLFFWIVVCFGVKGWALSRNPKTSSASLRAAPAKSSTLA